MNDTKGFGATMIVPILLAGLGGLTLAALARRDRHIRVKSLLPMPAAPSPVARQHMHLYQGGELDAVAVESAKSQWKAKVGHADAALRPGLQFVIQVRALAEMGGDEAARVLERQLGRNLSSDPIEQSWYWIDLAQGLRELSHVRSLPVLLRHADQALDLPLGALYAAEIVSFQGFQELLAQPLSHDGQAAIRVLLAALKGIRNGFLGAGLYTEAQLGEAIHAVAEACPDSVDPLVARLFLESVRWMRRTEHMMQILREDPSKAQAFRWQTAYLRSADPVVREYLHNIDIDLARDIALTRGREQLELLRAVREFHADAGDSILLLLERDQAVDRVTAIECLRYSKSIRVMDWLVAEARQISKPKRDWKAIFGLGKAPVPADADVNLAVLKTLRGHPCLESEVALLQLAQEPNGYRNAAISGMGWWEPINRSIVNDCLRRALQETATRDVALCALARLGVVSAIGELTARLTSKDATVVHTTIDLIMDEGISFLWPDLDCLTEHDDLSISSHAWEVLERMREGFLGPTG